MSRIKGTYLSVLLVLLLALGAACADDADDVSEADEGDAVDDTDEDEDVEPDAEEEVDDAEQPDESPAVTLEWGIVLDLDHAWGRCGVSTVEDELAAAPEANLELEVFPGGQLGGNEEMVEAVSEGRLDMTVPGVGSVSPFYAEFGVLEAFYAFDDLDHLLEVWEGEIGEELFDGAIEEANLRVLGDLWYIGGRHVTADFPVSTPEDLDGQSMRSQDTPASFANIRALGASPTPVDFGELYLALSQGIIDTQENPVPNIAAAALYEVQDYISLTNHAPQMGSVLISEDTWQSLTAEQQEALDAAVAAAADEVRTCIEDEEEEILDEWRDDDSPIEVHEDVDREAFQAFAEDFFAGTEDDTAELGDLFLRIRETSSE